MVLSLWNNSSISLVPNRSLLSGLLCDKYSCHVCNKVSPLYLFLKFQYLKINKFSCINHVPLKKLNKSYWVLLFLFFLRGNIWDWSWNSKSISKERCENCDSSKGFKKGIWTDGGNSKGESTGWNYTIGGWFELINFCEEILYSVLVTRITP